MDLKAKADRLRALHGGEMLVLPNVWDAASAKTVVEAGFPVVATASAAVSAMLGYPDGEGAPWAEMFAAAARVARAVPVPVTVDAEAGYGMDPRELVDRLLETGAVGCNLEDTDHTTGALRDPHAQADRLSAIRSAADDAGVPIVINARVDTFLSPTPASLDEAIHRGTLYRDAGADCIYPIAVRDKATITTLVTELACPVNGNTSDTLDLPTLRTIGVARVSYGPRFYRAALADLATSIRGLQV
ncbi:isocitrate lyase/PEP mutase family protein [Actinokineospora sp. NPDC004072]